MKCVRMQITDFRNIESADLTFSDGVNILSGENAQGKTNMLEAIYYTALGRAFRPARDNELITFGKESTTLINTFEDSVRQQSISMTVFYDRRARIVEQNKVKIKKLSDIVGAFKVVLFSPEHLSLVKEGPSVRRNFLDVALSQLYPIYLNVLQKAGKILKERNQLIKNAQTPEGRKIFDETVGIWSDQLAQCCAIISKYRAGYLKTVSELCREIFFDMSGENELPELIYKSSAGSEIENFDDVKSVEEKYRELYNTRHDREIGAETTLWGIHKDDVEILLNGKPARVFASQGQQRSIALAMKLAEGEICKMSAGGEYPVFLFDDVLSELDNSRRKYLLNEIKNRQVIMTTCELPDYVEEFTSPNIIKVKNGTYTNV